MPFAVLALLAALLSSSAQAADSGTVFLGVGAFFQNSMKTTTSPTASKSLLGTMYVPELSVSAQLGDASGYFYPTIGYTFLGKTGADGIKKRILTVSVPYAFPIWESVDLKLGIGAMLYRVGGAGEARVLNSGASTSTFYQPGTTQTSRALFLTTGLGFALSSDVRFDFDLIVTGALSSRRALNLAARFGIGVF